MTRGKVSVISVINTLILLGAVAILVVSSVKSYLAQPTSQTIEAAKNIGAFTGYVISKGQDYGLMCLLHTDECVVLIDRAEKNPQLKAALLKAKKAEVGIIPSSNLLYALSVGSVESGYVVVNIRRSDEKIASFLTK